MHPPVGGITKELCTDTTLGDITLPAKTMVFVRYISLLLCQLDAMIYILADGHHIVLSNARVF